MNSGSPKRPRQALPHIMSQLIDQKSTLIAFVIVLSLAGCHVLPLARPKPLEPTTTRHTDSLSDYNSNTGDVQQPVREENIRTRINQQVPYTIFKAVVVSP